MQWPTVPPSTDAPSAFWLRWACVTPPWRVRTLCAKLEAESHPLALTSQLRLAIGAASEVLTGALIPSLGHLALALVVFLVALIGYTCPALNRR